jgi:hypothetical protein
MISPEEFTVSKFKSAEEFKDFQCEKKDYSDFVQNPDEAQKYQNQNLGVTHVFKHQGKPVGFVTLAMGGLRKARLPEERQQQKPFRDVPSLLLGHWARDSRCRKLGVGKVMMAHALAKAKEIGQEIGCRYVIMDAEPDMVEHYKKWYKFELIPPEKNAKLFLMFFDLGLRAE